MNLWQTVMDILTATFKVFTTKTGPHKHWSGFIFALNTTLVEFGMNLGMVAKQLALVQPSTASLLA